MAPRKQRSKRRARGGSQIDTLHFPIVWLITAGSSAVTSVSTLSEQFDRRRPFRIASVKYQFSAEKAPAILYSVAFGPANATDSVWSSRPVMVPTGSVVRGNWRIPTAANLWYPSDTLAATYLFQVFVNCPSKGYPTRVSGSGLVSIQMGPWEPDTSCPALRLQPCLAPPPEDDESTPVPPPED